METKFNKRKTIEYILPVFNEAETLPELFKRLQSLESNLAKDYVVKFTFVNDGSSDNSMEILFNQAQKYSNYKVISFSRNFGHQLAITAGIDFADADAVVIMDADLQDPPNVSINLIKKWEEGFEVVYAQRRTRQDGIFKRATASVFYRLLSRLTEIKIPLDTGDFRLMDRKVVEVMKQFNERNRFFRGLVAFTGFRQTAVLFDRDKRYAGKTNYSLSKMMALAIDGITSFSTLPLKLITHFGIWVSILSFLGIVYALVLRIFFSYITVSGWTTLIFAVLFIGGVQMIMLGVIGTYIGRIYQEVQRRPLYIVDKIYEKGK